MPRLCLLRAGRGRLTRARIAADECVSLPVASWLHQTVPMNLPTFGPAFRWGLMLLLSVLAVWVAPAGGPFIFAGAVLAAVVVVGLFVKRGRNIWYASGVLAVFWGLWLGLVPSDSGPYSMANTGYGCGSVFAPNEVPISEDAPPQLALQCRAREDERKPFVVLIAGLGAYALVRSSRSEATTGPEAGAPRDAVKTMS